MKILLIDNASLTPIAGDFSIDTRTAIFAKELNELDNDVTVYGQVVVSNNQFRTYKLIENGLKVVGFKRKSNKLLNYINLYLKAIPQIVKNDFVYLFYPSSYKYLVFICRILGKPYGLYIRGEQGIYNKTSKRIYKKSTLILTVTKHFTDTINKINKRDNVFTIRPMMPFTTDDINLTRTYEKKKKYKILFLGRLSYDKGLRELLEAIDILNKTSLNFELDIVGDGGFMQETISLIDSMNIADRVNVIGAVNDQNKIADYYKSADIYVLPTYHEGFPRTLYEAMLFGTPILTTFVGGIPGLMKDGYNCKEIQAKSVDSIVEGLEFAINNYDKMIEYAQNGMKTVLDILNPNNLSHAQLLNKKIKTYAR